MNSIENNLRNIKRRIMLRVWYSYIVSVLSTSVTMMGIVLGVSGALFLKLVSVPSILMNLLQVQLGAIPQFVWQSLVKVIVNGEFLKIVTLGLVIFSLFYLRALLRRVSSAASVSHSNRFTQTV